MTEIPQIVEKYKNEDGWLLGQVIPTDGVRVDDVILLGEKPSRYFLDPNHKDEKYKGNYNATHIDKFLQEQLRKFDLRVYATDMVKTQGDPGAPFADEWRGNPVFKECLEHEIEMIRPRVVVAMSGKVEVLLEKDFPQRDFSVLRIYHPAYVFQYRNRIVNGKTALEIWDEQFEDIKTHLKAD